MIYFLAKFFERDEYARDFLSGRLWMNSFAYFKDLEASSNDGRADRYEGAETWLQPSPTLQVSIGGHVMPAADFAGPVVVQPRRYDSWNLFCMYAATPGLFNRVKDSEIDAFRRHVKIPERCRHMGPTCVLVHKTKAFIDRVLDATKPHRFNVRAGLVTYFDDAKFSGRLEHPTHSKSHAFSWQREYRFAIDRAVEKPEPYVLDVGPLEDICTAMSINTLDEGLRFEFTDAARIEE